MNALGSTITIVLGAAILFGSKRIALLALVAGILYLTQQQGIEVAGFNLYAFRLLQIAGLVRLLTRRDKIVGHCTSLDKLFIALYTYTVLIYFVRSYDHGFAYQIGAAVDALSCYFLFRVFASNIDDYRFLLRYMSVLIMLYAPLVVYESITFQNPFIAIGGGELIRAGDLWIRDGRLRAVGSFGHPSLMGGVGAMFLPLYVSAYYSGERNLLLLGGIIASLAMVWASNSGGPAACVAVAIIGWILWPLRHHMTLVLVAIVIGLLLLIVTMSAPIWYILARISALTGGDGFHRAALLDIAFQNLDRWWLAGMPVLETSRWLPYTNVYTGGVDLTNNYLVFGITAGLGSLLLFVAVLTKVFSSLGSAMKYHRECSRSQSEERLLWGLGVTVGVHLFNWFGITYFDQSNVVWLLHLALVSSLCSQVPCNAKESV